MWIIILLAFAILIVWNFVKSEPIPKGSPIITGARGAGKTRLAVIRIVANYRSKRFWWRFHKVPLLNWFSPKYEPHVYSNIPLRLTRKIYADVLKREHILMTEDLPKGSTVFIDEIGIMVNQYSHGDPNIISEHYVDQFHCAEIFTRFFRHFVGENEGDFVCTDQAVGDVNIQFRRRFDKALQLRGFHRFLDLPLLPSFMPFYKVKVDILDISEGDVQNTKNVNDVRGERQKFFFGYLPLQFPWSIRNYATHCYALAYEQKRFVSSVPFTNWKDNPDGLYTNYIIELRSDEQEMAAHNARKKLISKGIAPTKSDPTDAIAPIDADQNAVESPDQTSDLPEPATAPAEDPPRRSWFHRLLPRPAGRRERTREQT